MHVGRCGARFTGLAHRLASAVLPGLAFAVPTVALALLAHLPTTHSGVSAPAPVALSVVLLVALYAAGDLIRGARPGLAPGPNAVLPCRSAAAARWRGGAVGAGICPDLRRSQVYVTSNRFTTGLPPATRRGRAPAALFIGIALVLGATLGACSNGGDGTGVTIVDAGGTDGGLHGVIPTERFAKPALDLTDTDGRPFDLRARTQGKITLLFFGYTMCPDVCPTTMADIAAALDEVDRSVRDQVSVVFVSTDPDRDTAPVLDRWLNQFDASFLGVRGPFEDVRAQAEAIGVPLEEPKVQEDGSVLVAHGSQVIAFGRDARARVLYLAGTPVADYIADLPVLTAETIGTDRHDATAAPRPTRSPQTPGTTSTARPSRIAAG